MPCYVRDCEVRAPTLWSSFYLFSFLLAASGMYVYRRRSLQRTTPTLNGGLQRMLAFPCARRITVPLLAGPSIALVISTAVARVR